MNEPAASKPPKPKPKAEATVADVVAAADAVGAGTDAVVEVLRSRLKLSVIAISYALGIDAEAYIPPGVRRPDWIVAAGDQLWASVTPTGSGVLDLPELDGSWQAAAACRGRDPILWFCDDAVCDGQIEAVETCIECPAIGHCALAALREEHGLWGGMTHRNRRRLATFLRVGVVAAEPAAVAPLAAAVARSALTARIASQPPVEAPDGRLFDVPPAAPRPTAVARPRRRSAKVVERVPLFA